MKPLTQADIDRAVAKARRGPQLPADYEFTYPGRWSDEDEIFLDTVLGRNQHWDVNHDVLSCPDRFPSPDPLVRQLGERLGFVGEWRSLREETGTSIAGLGEAIGVHPGTVARWELGERHTANGDYRSWLRDQETAQQEKAQRALIGCFLKRGGFTKANPINRSDAWWIIFSNGGLFDVWAATGEFAHFAPEDFQPLRDRSPWEVGDDGPRFRHMDTEELTAKFGEDDSIELLDGQAEPVPTTT